MSFLKTVGKGLKKVAKVATKIGKHVPGPLSVPFSAANAALEGKPILKSVGKDSLTNAKIAATVLPIALTAGAASPALAGAMSGVGGAGAAGAGAAGAAGAGGGGGFFSGGLGGTLKTVGGFAKDNPELILGGLSAVQGARDSAKANRLNEQALNLAKQPWEETAALRQMALQRLTAPQRPDLSSIYSGSSNPFARPLRSV